MELRLPWILSRKRLIISAVVDGIIAILLYCMLYRWVFGVWKGFSLSLVALLIIWSLVSYVTGRYPGGDQSYQRFHVWNFIGKQFIATVLAFFLTIGITFFYTWAFSLDPYQASSVSFLLTFLGLLSVLSSFLQLTLLRFLVLNDTSKNTWLYVGSDSGYNVLNEKLIWSRVQVCVEHILPSQLGQASNAQFIVDSFYDQPSYLLEKLQHLQQQGAVVLNRLSWCEKVLQRFPSSLV